MSRHPSLVLMLLALVVRIAAAMQIPALTYDGTYYLRQAMRLLQGSYVFESFPPGLPLMVALFSFTGADLEFVARCINLVAGTASVGLTYSLARRHLGAGASALLAFLLAVHPVFVRVQVEVMSEPLYLLAILAAFNLYERRKMTLCGACLGYAFLLRPEGLALLVGLTIAYFWNQRRVPWGMLLAGLLPVAVYSFLASQELGTFVITPKQGQWDLSAETWTRLKTTARTLHMTFPLILLPLAVYEGVRRRSALLLPALYLAVLPLYDIHIQQRIHLPALPFLGILALVWLAQQSLWIRRSLAAASVVLLVWGTAGSAVSFFKPGVMVEHSREVGHSLRPYLEFDDVVASRFPFIPWYGGGGFLRMELWPYEALMDSIQSQGATHLLVLENEVVNVRPQLRPLFESAAHVQAESRLRLVHREERYPFARALLYELQEPPIPRDLPPVETAVVSVAWLQNEWIAVDQQGHLQVMQAAPLGRQLHEAVQQASLTDLREVAISPLATQVAFLQADGRLRVFHRNSATWRSFDVAVGMQPFQLTWIDEQFLLFLRGSDPGGVAALDTQGSRIFPVELAGVAPSSATPTAMAARTNANDDVDLAITYRRNVRDKPLERAIATTRWPATSPDPSQTLQLQIRWGTFIQLHDDRLSWVPGSELLVSQAILLFEGKETVGHFGSLSVVREGGQTRRLSFHYPDVTTPVFRRESSPGATSQHLMFLGSTAPAGTAGSSRQNSGTLRLVELQANMLEIPPVRVFENPQLRP